MIPRWMICEALGNVNFSNLSRKPALIIKGICAMSDKLNQIDEEILSYEVSDEALETAGSVGSENAYTLGACSGLSVCPS